MPNVTRKPTKNWRSAELRVRMTHLLRSRIYTDCQFLVGREKCDQKLFHCHKLVLCTASEVFDRMLFGHFVEASTTEPIVIDDATPDDFQNLLMFIYGNQLGYGDPFSSLKWPRVKGLLKLAHKYMVDGIKEACTNNVDLYTRTMDEALEMFAFAHDLDDEDIKDCACDVLQQIFESAGRILGTIECNFVHNARIPDMPINVFIALIGRTPYLSDFVRFCVSTRYIQKMRPYPHELTENNYVEYPSAGVDDKIVAFQRNFSERIQEHIEAYNKSPRECPEGPNALTEEQKYEIILNLTLGIGHTVP